MLGVMMQSVAFCYCYAADYYTECRYAECRYAECRGAVFDPIVDHSYFLFCEKKLFCVRLLEKLFCTFFKIIHL